MFSSYVSEITPTDKRLLQAAVLQWRPSSKNYEDSWGYVIQATRCKGFKWYNSETGSLIFFGIKPNEKTTLVVPVYFALPEELQKVVQTVHNQYHATRTILKNVNPAEVNMLLSYGFRQYHDDEVWSPAFPLADQAHPQLVIDLEKLRDIKNRIYHKLRNELNKNHHVIIRKYHKSDKEAVLEVFAARDGTVSKNISEKVEGMYYSSHVMYPEADIDKFVAVDKIGGEIVGFMAISSMSATTAAFVASIFKPATKHVRAWCEYHVLLAKYYEGFRLINLGGSESEGDYHFKLWTFRPVKELAKTHLVYGK